MSEPNCGTGLRNAFLAYATELNTMMMLVELQPDLFHDWLRFRLAKLGQGRVSDLSPANAAKLYEDMQAAFPLTTVPLDNADLPVAPVPYQQPLPSITPEFAERVWRQLREVCGPTGLTTVQLMEIMQEAADHG